MHRLGFLKVAKAYRNGKIMYGVYGKDASKNWTLCFENTEDKPLVFDLEYDACGWMVGFINWRNEQIEEQKQKAATSGRGAAVRELLKAEKRLKSVTIDEKKKNERRTKSKMARRSRRGNRR